MNTVAPVRWVLAVLAVVLLFIGTALASVLDHAPAPEFAPETPNIGTGHASLLPIDQPLSATLFLTGGTGVADDPYSFCVISARGDGQPSCLFNQALVGVSGELPLFEWYRLTASFVEAPADGGGVGRVLAASPTTWARVAGPARERQSRFNERWEALSDWAVAHGIIGYLRADGIYVWYLSAEAAQDVKGLDMGPIITTWTAAS